MLLVALLIAGYDLEGAIWTVLALAAVNAVAERSGIWVTLTTQMSIALLPTLFAAVLFGPLAAGIVNAASMLGDPPVLAHLNPDRHHVSSLRGYTSSRFITPGVAAWFRGSGTALGVNRRPLCTPWSQRQGQRSSRKAWTPASAAATARIVGPVSDDS